VAVVGSGIAGLSAAHRLARHAHVTLFEADQRLGGHADTHLVTDAGRRIAVDTGFIVHNDRTYPTLCRLFEELAVPTQETDMSMSVRADEVGLEYAGARGIRGLFPSAAHLGRPRYLRMLGEVRRFHRRARALLADAAGAGEPDTTLREFVDDGGFTPFFGDHFLRPLVSAVWSCEPGSALDYPARYLFEFLDHHGMLTVFGSPTWRTVVGGSARYVERVAAGLDRVHTGRRVVSVRELADHVTVADDHGGRADVDAVVVATHPHQALRVLDVPSPLQRRVLGSIAYTPNVAQLHTDSSVLPRRTAARASWNYWCRPDRAEGDPALVTYDLSRLHRLPASDRRFLVTLGAEDVVDQRTVLDTMEYEHPLYTPDSVAAQRLLPQLNTPRVAFAGAYHGWGFHEDGARSGVEAAEHLLAHWRAQPVTAAAPCGASRR
jgi:predicted NAD/FAD-binding protein